MKVLVEILLRLVNVFFCKGDVIVFHSISDFSGNSLAVYYELKKVKRLKGRWNL